MAPVFLDRLPPLASPLGFALIAVAGFVLLYLIERYVLDVPYPQGIPIVGQPAGARRLSLRTRLRYYTNCESLFREAYDNVRPLVDPARSAPRLTPAFSMSRRASQSSSLASASGKRSSCLRAP